MTAYDLNFCFPVPNTLENGRIRLVPFIPHIHAEQYLTEVEAFPQLYDYLPYGPFRSLEEINQLLELRIRQDPASLLFAIYDISNSGTAKHATFAGCIGYLNATTENLGIEIGHILILPAFQRTHVTSNSIGLLLRYALDLPSVGGLGLRRVAWQANALNKKSIKAAERMGFSMEGILRWQRVLPPGKTAVGSAERAGDPMAGCPGRDTAMMSLCWDDWEAGGREHVDKVMARTT